MRFFLLLYIKTWQQVQNLYPIPPPYMFKSLGVKTRKNTFEESTDFPIGTKYELTAGKFPLTDYNDAFSESGLYHTLDKNIEVKIIEFDTSCEEGKLNKHGSCKIKVERRFKKEEATTGGRKNKSNRRKTNRRKTNRRKSNRRKTNRRR